MAHYQRRIDHDAVIRDFFSAKFSINELAVKHDTQPTTISDILTKYFKRKRK